MLRRSTRALISNHYAKRRREFPLAHEYRELSRWQRESTGLTDWQNRQSRPAPAAEHRFNPNWVGLSSGTPPEEAQKWLHFDQMKLPHLMGEGQTTPQPLGRQAWPASWDEEFASKVLDLSESELEEYTWQQLTETIHEEAQRDGIELRRLDMEGNPMSDLPPRAIIEKYLLEESTLRDRIVARVLDGALRLPVTSRQLEGMKSTRDVVNFVLHRVRLCRPKKEVLVTEAVLEFLERQPIQPEFGYHHALPQDTRDPLVKGWERSFHYRWQFGNAVYRPRIFETSRTTNPHYLDTVNMLRAREDFEKRKAAGQLKEEHLQKIREAAAA